MKKYLFLISLLSFSFLVQAQHRTCGTMAHDSMLQQTDPHYVAHRQGIENFVQNYVASHPNGNNQRSVITIPVVVHIVYNNAAGNISQAQIQSEIDRVNLDYHKLNADTASVPTVWKPLIADCNIQFCLAQKDPNGNATTGVVRVSTTTSSFSTNDAVKYTAQGGSDAWPAASYLNIWVCNLGGGLLGYSQFPGGPAATDGCVILNTAFGSVGSATTPPYNLGRTVTHEVGHWLNLYHTWGDDNGACTGSDQVADTPNSGDATYGCPTFPLLDNCATASPGVMFMNYMDYTDDACMYMFTNGQNARIQANFANGGPRASILNSTGCQSISPGPVPAFVANKTSICVGQSVNFTDQSTGAPTSWSWSFSGGTPSTSTQQNPSNIVYSAPGTYSVTLTVTNAVGTNPLTKTGYITVLGTTPLPLQEGFQTATFVPTGWTLYNPDNQAAWTRSTSAGGYGTSTASAYFDNFNSNYVGQRDYMYTPIYNFTNAGSSAKLKFDYAYASDGQAADTDSLEFIYSTDCGATWTRLWQKGGTALQTTTTAYTQAGFVPTATQWKSDSVSLSFLSGQSSVQFGIVNICKYGQFVYVDNINIDTASCARPAAPTTAILPTTACANATAVYSVPAVTGATSYTWTVSGTGWSGTSTTNNITVTTGAAAATISVTANNTCGASAAYSFSAPLTPAPASPASITSGAVPCSNTTATYSVPAVTGATSYTWTVNGTGWSGTSTTNSITLTAGTTAANISVTANNTCGSSRAFTYTASVNTVPSTPTSITLPATPCSNTTATYTTPAITGATSYTWTVSGTGWSGTSNTNIINLTAGNSTGTLTVKANNACGTSNIYSISTPVAALPATPSSAILPAVPCTGANALYSVPAVTGATSYTWALSGNGWSGNSTNNAITLTAGTADASISVTANNTCGSSAAYTFTAPVNIPPLAPVNVSLPTAPCTGYAATYSIPSSVGASSYTWTIGGNGWTGSSNTNSITLTSGNANTNVSVTANNACGSSTVYSFVATVKNKPTSLINQAICSGQSYLGYSTPGTYVDTLRGLASNGCDSIRTLQLSIQNTITTTVNKSICQGQSYLGHSTTGAYNDTFMATGGCDSIRTLQLSVQPAVTTSENKTICQGQTYLGHNTSGTFVDTLAAANACDSLHTLNLVVVPSYNQVVTKSICQGDSYAGHDTTGTYIDTYTTAVGGCDSVVTLKLAVIPKTNVNIAVTQGNHLSTGVFTSYQWLLNDTIIPSATSANWVAQTNGNYSVVINDGLGCNDTSAAVSVTTLGIGETIIDANISIYPNPNDGSFIIQTANCIGKTIIIADLIGRQVAQQVINNDKQLLQLNSLANGTYIVGLSGNAKPLKLIIEH